MTIDRNDKHLVKEIRSIIDNYNTLSELREQQQEKYKNTTPSSDLYNFITSESKLFDDSISLVITYNSKTDTFAFNMSMRNKNGKYIHFKKLEEKDILEFLFELAVTLQEIQDEKNKK
jgi:hypothetical protein